MEANDAILDKSVMSHGIAITEEKKLMFLNNYEEYRIVHQQLDAITQQLSPIENQKCAGKQELMVSEMQLRTINNQLLHSENRFRHVYKHMAVGIVYFSLDFKIQGANEAFCQMIGYKEADLVKRYFKDLTRPEILKKNFEQQKKLISGEVETYHMEKQFVHKDGHTVFGMLDISLIRGIDRKPQYLLCSILDISERKKAEEDRSGLQYNLEDVIESSPDAIMIADANGRNKYVNQRFMDITGYTLIESLKLSLKEITPEADFKKYAQMYRDRLQGKSVLKLYERTVVTKGGNIVPVEMRTTTTIWEGEKCGLTFMTDITDRKKIENDMKDALEKAKESDNLKSAFLANMSHEIRTPMNGVLGFTELLLTPGLSIEEQKKYISIIKTSGDRMLSTVNAIIDISKLECGQMEVFIEIVNINNKLESLFKFFKLEAESKGLRLLFDNRLEEKEHMIQTDITKFNSIVTNLIKNAIKFTIEGTIEIKVEKKAECIQISIKDTGIGIPENRKDSIFNRFEQAHIYNQNANQGSGLGLAISKSYVEMLGGKIWFKSEEGAGSVFYFILPV